MVRSAGSLCSHWRSRLISQVSKSTGRTSTPISCSSRSAYSLTGIGIDSPPLPTLIPISQIEMELTKMRSASAMAADAAADRRSRCRVQKRSADVSSTTTMRQPIRRWSQRLCPRGIPTALKWTEQILHTLSPSNGLYSKYRSVSIGHDQILTAGLYVAKHAQHVGLELALRDSWQFRLTPLMTIVMKVVTLYLR